MSTFPPLESPEMLSAHWHNAEVRATQAMSALMRLAWQLCRPALEAELQQPGQPLFQWEPDQWVEFIGRSAARGPAASSDATPADWHEQLEQQHTVNESLCEQLEQERAVNETLREQLEQQRTANETLRGQLIQRQQALDMAHMQLPQPMEPRLGATLLPADQVTDDDADADFWWPASLLTPRSAEVVRYMARTGITRMSQLRPAFAHQWHVAARGASVLGELRAVQNAGWIMRADIKSEWPGAPKVVFLILTPAGEKTARHLGVDVVENEVARAERHGVPLPQLAFMLRAADVLSAAHYHAVVVLPEAVALPTSATYQPDLAATAPDGTRLFIACERTAHPKRVAEWAQAAQANAGRVWIITPNAEVQRAVLTELRYAQGAVTPTFQVNVCCLAQGVTQTPLQWQSE